VQDALDDGGVRLGEQCRGKSGEAVPECAAFRCRSGAPGGDELREGAGGHVSGGEDAAGGPEGQERRGEHVVASQHRKAFRQVRHQHDGVVVDAADGVLDPGDAWHGRQPAQGLPA